MHNRIGCLPILANALSPDVTASGRDTRAELVQDGIVRIVVEPLATVRHQAVGVILRIDDLAHQQAKVSLQY